MTEEAGSRGTPTAVEIATISNPNHLLKEDLLLLAGPTIAGDYSAIVRVAYPFRDFIKYILAGINYYLILPCLQ